MSTTPSKPLFAAGVLSSGNIAQENDSPGTSSLKDSIDDHDLALLKLELHPSTLGAIIAAQKPGVYLSLQESSEFRHCEDRTLRSVIELEETSHKRKFSTDSDSDELIQEYSSKQRKRSKDKHKKKKKKKHKQKKQDHSESLDSKHSSKIAHTKVPKNAVFLEDIKDMKPEHAFHIDKSSNKDLWHYKSLSKLQIAKYKPFSYNCLGAFNLFIKEIKNENKGSKVSVVLPRYFKKEGLKCIYRKGLDSTFIGKGTSKVICHDFISFPKDGSENADTENIGNYSCLDDATALYVQGKDAHYKKEPEMSSDNFIMDEIFEKVRRYNKRTQDEPQNVQLWLEFVQFQDVVAQEDKSFKNQTPHLRHVYQPSRTVIEKKLAILDKAIEVNPSSLELKMAQLELCQDIWQSEKLEKAWRDLLFVHSANVDLWQHYLSKQQSQLLKFSFSRILKCYHQSFKTLVRILDGQLKALNKKEDMEEKILGLFGQYCNFLHQCGYTERAVSSYQALIEFNHFCPASLNISTSQERLSQFEEFWDSSVPKFGEQKAKGWTKWTESKNNKVDATFSSVSTEEQEDAIILEKLPRCHTWLKMEEARQDVQWLSWRPDVSKGETNESCEDLDRVVLFDDISPAIFRLTKSESCIRVVCMFLKFLGLSSETLDRKLEEVSKKSSSSADFDQYSAFSEIHFHSLSSLKCGIDVDSIWRPHDYLVAFISEVLIQAETYFSLSNRVTFTLLRMELEVLKNGVRRISEVSKSNAKIVKRFGKSLLKENQNRNNLVIWDSYIRLLWACSDKMEETMSMLDTALTMFMGTFNISGSDNALGLCLLCKTYCQIMLNFEPLEHIKAIGQHSIPSVEDKHQVIACLSALVENRSFKCSSKYELSPAYMLKIRKRFQTTLDDMYIKIEQSFEHSLTNLILALTDCFALFELCASGYKTASNVYNFARENVKQYQQTYAQKDHMLSLLLKQLYLSHLSFSVNVMYISFISRTELRQVLNEALQKFPECPEFHMLFLETESGSHIVGRIRKFYDKTVRNPVSLTIPLFVIMSELTRHYTIVRGLDSTDFQLTDSGAVHRVRSVFEQSLQCQVSGHCPLLWRLYISFEAKYGSKIRAKGIFYRALQSCPWAKCIYMDGIAIFGDSELQEVMDLMTEKEIRVRMPLEEVDLLLNADKMDQEDEKFGIDLDVDNNDEEIKLMTDAFENNT